MIPTPDQPSSGSMLDENMEKKNGGSVKANKKRRPSLQNNRQNHQTAKINLKKRNQYGEYEIHKACKRLGTASIWHVSGNFRVDVNVTDNNKNTALHEAVENNQLECIKTLLNFCTVQNDGVLLSPDSKAWRSRV